MSGAMTDLRERIRAQHLAHIATSADRKDTESHLAFVCGWQRNLPAANDVSRRMRRKLERLALKKMQKGVQHG